MYNLNIFIMATFYVLMVLVGVVYAILVTQPRDESQSIAGKYPIIGVMSFFGILALTYYLLRLADKTILHVYCGVFVIVASYFVAATVYRCINENKNKK